VTDSLASVTSRLLGLISVSFLVFAALMFIAIRTVNLLLQSRDCGGVYCSLGDLNPPPFRSSGELSCFHNKASCVPVSDLPLGPPCSRSGLGWNEYRQLSFYFLQLVR
jgi:hypothetical protein